MKEWKPIFLILANIWFIVAILSSNERLAIFGLIIAPVYFALSIPRKDKC